MKKKTAIILLIVLALVGSFVNFFATNLLMSDLSNMFYGVHDIYIVASFPLFVIAIDLIVAFIFVFRLFKNPNHKKGLIKLYSLYLIINSVIGIIVSVFTGASDKVYGSFFVRYPFFCYPLIMLLLHLGLTVVGVYFFIYALKKLPDDPEKKKVNLKYIFYTAFAGVMLYLAYYRVGTLLWSPVFIHWRSLYLSFPFYIFLATPLALILYVVFYFTKVLKTKKCKLIYTGVTLGVILASGVATILIAIAEPLLISAISPALPIERLSSMAVGVPISLGFLLLNGGIFFLNALLKKE